MPERTEYAEGTPSWIDLATTGPAAAKQFYGDLFGWTFDDMPAGPDMIYTMCSKQGRFVAGLSAQPPEQAQQGVPPMWNTYVTVDDVDSATKRAENAGGTVFMAPFDVMDSGRMAVVGDPAGAVVSMWQARDHIGAQLVNEPGSLCWNELVTPDVERAKAFYGSTFGWTAEPMEAGGMPYTIFNVAGNAAAGATTPPMEGIPPHWAVYFAVDDTDATVAQAKARGATVVTEALDSPAGRMAGLRDPQGAAFWVIKTPPPGTPT